MELKKFEGGENLQEVNIKSNNTGLDIYINDKPNIKCIPEDVLDILASELEMKLKLYLKTFVLYNNNVE